MPTSIETGLNPDFPVSFINGPDRSIYAFNGIDRWRKWDDTRAAVVEAGMRAGGVPAFSGASSGGLGTGNVEGSSTYYLSVVYVDGDDNIVGNGSSIEQDTVGYVQTLSTDTVITATLSASYEPDRATAIKVYRSLADDPSVLYLIENASIALGTTSLTSYESDADISENEAIVAVNTDADPVTELNKGGLPPFHMSSVVSYQNRLFAAVPVPYDVGMAEVTNGSATVTGIGTSWPDTWSSALYPTGYHGYLGSNETQYFQVVGDTERYTVLAASGTSITLTANYAGTTSKHARYVVYPAADEALAVRYTYLDESPEPESWPSANSVQCHSPGGAITALIISKDFMYIAKQAKMYKFSTQVDPKIDGSIDLELPHRGCENPRTWVLVEGAPFVMDRQGIYTFGGGEVKDVSEPIWPIFRDGRINWAASRWFHATYDPERRTVRFFVAMDACYTPRQALCFNLLTGAWWIEEYPFGVGASCQATLKGGRRRTLLGGPATKIVLADEGSLDGPTPLTTQTLRGTVTSATHLTITDSLASHPSLAGYPVSIVDGRGKGQTRTISAVSSGTITVTQPWLVKPDTTSTYQIGGFQWKWTGSALRYTARPSDTSRGVQVYYEPTEKPAHLFFRRYENHNRLGHAQGSPCDSGPVYDHDGVTVNANDPDVKMNLYRKQSERCAEVPASEAYDDEGARRYQFDGNAAAPLGSYDRWVTPELHGHSSADIIKIYSLVFDGVR